ncbi:hypothetical protein SAMN05445756_1850 [Kytococcus aerolatus]|uniref:Uncharacterized protein n=1 Tax=Kytococcus aerolatus TaxID=592308 RepID=A0A212U2H5_9MICO|nr:hypothetical protein [Kytococcus aerolatus]SNC72452.1 hypothetical protein SAMN05445756_1850 [Kytococcus aerolatus]
MDNRVLLFLAIAVTIMYGVGFTAIDWSAYASVGAGVVTVAWVAYGMLGRDEH